MTVVLDEDRGAWWMPADLICFLCEEVVSPPAVLWQGTDPIVLHADCAESLGAHLLKDGQDAKDGSR